QRAGGEKGELLLGEVVVDHHLERQVDVGVLGRPRLGGRRHPLARWHLPDGDFHRDLRPAAGGRRGGLRGGLRRGRGRGRRGRTGGRRGGRGRRGTRARRRGRRRGCGGLRRFGRWGSSPAA